MILCEEPYLNEPGWATSSGTPQSNACLSPFAYNYLVQLADSMNPIRFRECSSDGSQNCGTSSPRIECLLERPKTELDKMLGNLKIHPEPFGDIIRTHFRLKARSISAQLDRWLSQDDGLPTVNDGASSSCGRAGAGGSANGLQTDVEELKRLMKQLQDGSNSSSAVHPHRS